MKEVFCPRCYCLLTRVIPMASVEENTNPNVLQVELDITCEVRP